MAHHGPRCSGGRDTEKPVRAVAATLGDGVTRVGPRIPNAINVLESMVPVGRLTTTGLAPGIRQRRRERPCCGSLGLCRRGFIVRCC